MSTGAEHQRLRTLLRLRQAERDSARHALGEALAEEEQARRARTAAEAAILAETRLAVQSGDDQDVERFARWLTRGRARLRATETALAEAAVQTSHKRAELTLLHAAADATAEALAHCEHQQQLTLSQAAQRDMDEQAQQQWQTRRHDG